MDRDLALRRTAFYVTFAAAVAPLVSIAVSQVLIGASLVALVAAREKLRLPPIKLPLGLFMLATVISLLASPDPAGGWPQIRKFYVLLTLPIVYTAFRSVRRKSRLTVAWLLTATASALVSFVQFALKYRAAQAAGEPFYLYYVGERTTGFMSHWQTFGGGMMLALMLAGGFVLFSPAARRRMPLWLGCAALVALAIVLGFTRNVWLGSFAGGLYLLWHWRRKVILAVPVALVLALVWGPPALRERFVSFVHPHGEADSNQHRIVTWRTGLRMIEAHPLLGLGPEQVGPQFEKYVPADVPRPLPEGWYGHLHDNYLHYAAERGVPAMLFLVWFLFRALFDFIRAARRRTGAEGSWCLHGAAAGVIAIFVAGFFEVNLGDSEVLTMFLVLISCGYAVIDTGAEGVESA